MFKRIALLILIATSAIVAANAQNNGKVTGKVLDGNTGEPLEYANITLLKASDSVMANGTVSASNGSFTISAPSGRYILKITFIGYEPYFHPAQITLQASKTLKVGSVNSCQFMTILNLVWGLRAVM